MGAQGFLDKAYGLDAQDKTRAFYSDWAGSYDREVAENGYATPGRSAALLAASGVAFTAPVLDIGCGTGISGTALAEAGFQHIDGTDFSQEMLALAAEKRVYRSLTRTDVADPLPIGVGAYAAIAAIGLFSPGHAPAETIDHVLAKLGPGGRFVFSLNDHALDDPSYEGRVREHTDCGNVTVEARDYGDHLPRIGLNALVYVLAKT
ncbi:MAG: methyltransferase domain-containing protein [Pseudomonadota bacterium]